MKRLIIGLLLVVLLLVSVGCPPPAPVVTAPPMLIGDADFARTAAQRTAAQVDFLPVTAEVQRIVHERMIVHTGDMSLVVDDVVDARDEIARLAVRFDGFVVSSWIRGEEQDMRGWISLRVPADKFEQALAKLRELAVSVTSESTASLDVTEEYIDLGARLRNAEATESQYLALLEKATVEEIIRIYELLHRVRREIEQIRGRMLYLERTVSMSLITVFLEPVAPDRPLVRAGWSAEALNSAVRGFVTTGQWLGTTAIWLIIFSPVWGAILGVILWRRRRKGT